MEAQNVSTTARYSDTELDEFRVLIEKKLETANQELEYLQEQILEITENSGDDHGGDWMDDSSTNNDIEFLNNMAIRQRKYIQDLENALIRIRNKSYGICSVTGQLIEKRRLLAVPTATKSVEAKTAESVEAPKRPAEKLQIPLEQSEKKEKLPPATPKIITKVIRKPTKPAKPVNVEDDDDLDFDFDKEYAYDGGGANDDAGDDDDFEKGGGGGRERSDSFDDDSTYNDIPDDSGGGGDDDY